MDNKQVQKNRMDNRESLGEGTILRLEPPKRVEMDGQSGLGILELQGEFKEIVIEKQIGRGSTSIVYEGRISGGTKDGSPVIVKEFYPYPENDNFYDIYREPDGKLKVSEFAYGNSSYQERKSQFLKCAEKQKKLSDDKKVREIIVRYEGFYQYGDSYYILSQVHSGHVLQLEQFRFLKDKLEVMKDMADIISVLQCNNFLFLDLCPQNLLWVNVSETKHLMMLFDVDSILDLGNIENLQRSDFYLPGKYDTYDAPEMRELLNEPADEFETMKKHDLNIAMNIYNLGILFFEILFERLPRQEELRFENNTEAGLAREFTSRYRNSLYGLEDVSQKVIGMLKTALSESPEKRMPAKELSLEVKGIMEKMENASVIAKARREITEASRAQLLETVGTKTRIIAFDESGQFNSENPEICFIGGFTGDFHDADAEREAMEELLRDACERFNRDKLMKLPIEVRYPGSLHGSGSPFFKKKPKDDKSAAPERKPLEGEEKNKYSKLELEFKDEYLERAVVEYLEKKKYRLFVFMNIPNENQGDTAPNIIRSNLTDMEKGSNLYERMAILTLYDYVFSMEHDVDNYRFELPTRTLDAMGDEDLYSVYANNRGDVKKSITNTSTYKTAISVMLFEKNKDIQKLDTNYVFNVNPINYFDSRKESTPFLYAADIVCRYIRKQIRKLTDKDGAGWKAAEDGFMAELHEISKADIHIYGACEDLYRTMVDRVKRVDIGEYYALCYDLEHTDEPYRKFYMEYWLPRVEQFLSACLQMEQFSEQFKDRIPEYIAYMEMFMGKRGVHYEKGLYIAEHMEKYILSLRDYNKRNAVLFDVYDIILRGYNHRGALDKAKEYITKCEMYKYYVEMPKYIEYALRVMQIHFDSFEYEKVRDFGRILKKAAEKLKNVYKSFYEEVNAYIETISEEENISDQLPVAFVGKIYSSLGQAYAFIGESCYEDATNYFQKALDEFRNDEENRDITLSYLMHLLISHGEKNLYEARAIEYFGDRNLSRQMDNAFAAKGYYKLFVFVKAFNVFYMRYEANGYIFDELLNRIKLLDSKDKTYHPWELIYKNLYECILKKRRDMLDCADYRAIRANALTCVKNADYTIKMIQLHARLVFAELENKDKFEVYDLEEMVDDDEIDLCEKVIGEVRGMTPMELKELLDDKMGCYMYS